VPQLQSSSEDINRLYSGFDAQIDRNAAIHSSTAVSRREGTSTFTRLTMNDGKGVGHWDVLRLHDDLLVCLADSYYHDRFNFDVRPPVNLVSMRFVVSGALQLRTRRTDAIMVEQGTASILSVPSVSNHVVTIEARKRLASLTLHFHADRLKSIMGMEEQEFPELLRSIDSSESSLQYCSMPLTPAMKNGVLDIVETQFAGALRRRYIEAKVMELFCLFVDAADRSPSDPQQPAPLPSAERERLYHAREILCTDFLDPPSIGALARDVGINRTKLQRDFKEMFGVTIFDFCHDKRMTLARELLRDRDMSIGEVADAVGYGHATNFTAAFRRHFKQLPKQLRARRKRS
jgi:AraC family transcriptional regulator, transcriptional activator of the genes for pyochelin and ferripyochelin receptors